MSIQPSGRSSPRVLQDLLEFVPGSRLMAQPPPVAAKLQTVRPLNHIAYLENHPNGQVAVSLDGSKQVFYAILVGSMHHIELQVSATEAPVEMFDFHLVDDSERANVAALRPGEERYAFVCSLTGAQAVIVISPPMLTNEDLIDFEETRVAERFAKFREFKPSASCPTPAMCFSTLYNVINQPLTSEDPKEIMKTNPTLNMRLNPDILERRLHFIYDSEREVYIPPDLNDFSKVETAHLRRDMGRLLLEAAARALQWTARASQVSNYVSLPKSPFSFQLADATPILRSALKCHAYATAAPSRFPNSSLTPAQYGNYVALGAVADFGDDLLWTRYQRQSFNDPGSSYIYTEALKEIAQLRQSEQLEIKVMELLSMGALTESDVIRAFGKFNLAVDSEIDETALIETYKQLAKDDPSSHQSLREALQVIADTRKSETLHQTLATEQMNLEEAYRFLDAQPQDPDSAVQLNYVVKAGELGEDKEAPARKALLTIAQHRVSFELLTYYESLVFGTMPEIPIDSAYELLGIDKSFDENSIITVFDIRRRDNPDEILELRQALRVIGEVKESKLIPLYLETGKTKVEPSVPILWPVGLNNIGNTCYLNSLLQYYFTITPLRQAVLTFSESPEKEDLTKDFSKKKVGGRAVPAWEVKRAQEFVELLSGLFTEMIHTNSTHVSPKKDLAYLALVPARDEPEPETSEDLIEITPPDASPALQETNVRVRALSTNESATETSEEMSVDAVDSDAETDIEDLGDEREGRPALRTIEGAELGSSHNEAFVVSRPGGELNKENERPKRESSSEDEPRGLKRRVSRPVSEAMDVERSGSPTPDTSPTLVSEDPTPINPPIIVPNASSEEKSRRIDDALIGRQQDVTECIENVLFQIESALKPKGYDEDGEQLDIVKELFYGKTKQVLESVADGSNRREKTERFSNLLVDVAGGPRDIYEALDSYFGEDVIQLEGGDTRRAVTIAELPPILQIQVQRVQFDRVLNRPYKSLALLKFDEVIYMDRYLDANDAELIEKRREVWAWRTEIADLKARLKTLNAVQTNGLTTRDSLVETREWLLTLVGNEESSMKVSPATVDVLGKEIARLDDEIKAVSAKLARLEESVMNQFADFRKVGYRIHSVFMHRGQATYGHYWIYINDFEKGVFRKYNDEYVTEARREEVFDESEENTATPYYLVFIREDLSDKYAQALLREPDAESDSDDIVVVSERMVDPPVPARPTPLIPEVPSRVSTPGDIEPLL